MTTSLIQSIARWRQAPDDDAAAIAASRQDPAAFALLYDRYVQSIYRYMVSRTGSAAEAEDLTSQTFLAALEALPRYRHQGNFAAWLFRIARGKLIDQARKQSRLAPLPETVPAQGRDLFEQVAAADEISRLAALIGSLQPDEQELIHLRYSVGLPFAEIAAILDSNANTVKKSLYRLMARLQSRLEERQDE